MDAMHIKKRYPQLFTLNATICIEDGWCWLLAGLCDALDNYSCETYCKNPLLITCVEQRLGALTILYHGGDRIAENMICAVQLVSNTVCQSCAATMDVGSTVGPDINTLCRNCWSRDVRYHPHCLSLNVFSEATVCKIESGLLYMPDRWYRRRLNQLLK